MKCHAVRRFVVMTSSVAVLFAALSVVPAHAKTPTVHWVSPSGGGTLCTNARPCSVDTALRKVKSTAPKMRADIIVRMTAGTYRRVTPITLEAGHSGRNGHRVRIEPARGATVVVSGGSVIRNWTRVDAAKNIWRAPAPRHIPSRQLFVNGKRATVASGDAATVMGAMEKTPTGYTTTSTTMAGWENIGFTELVFPGGGHDPDGEQAKAPWSHTVCAVSAVNGTSVTMRRGCWDNANFGLPDLDGTRLAFITKPTRVQNNYALLDEPGEFYLDQSTWEVFYKPRSGENLATASTIMPRAVSLLRGAGVRNVTVSGIVFEHARYTPTLDLGVVTVQANVIAGRAGYAPTDASTLATIPAAVTFSAGTGIRLQSITVRRSGGAGISFSGGGAGNVVRGAFVHDVASNGITISEGLPLDRARTYERDTIVEHSAVQDVGVDYPSAVGIMAGWVQRVQIRDNRVSNVPHVGIGVGWGWMNKSAMVDNHVLRNTVRNAMSSSLDDGGAIYLQGGQGNSTASTALDNHIVGYRKNFGAIYLDSGASHWLVARNVVEDIAGSAGWLYLQNIPGHGMAWSNMVVSNYTDTSRQFEAPLGPHETNKVDHNIHDRNAWPKEALATVQSAGPKGSFSALR